MKPYLQLLGLLALALAGAIGWRVLSADPGYLLLSVAGWSVETTLVVAVGLGLLVLFALWLLLWLLRSPFRLWRRRRRARARERLAGAVVALQEGRWKRADKLLRQASGEAGQRNAALLLAAATAEQQGDRERCQQHLAALRGADIGHAALIVNARQLLQDGRPALACELLEAAARERSLPPMALELRALALQAAGRASEALNLVPELRRSRLREGQAQQNLETGLAASALSQAATAGELGVLWSSLSRALRADPQVVAAYARRGDGLGIADAAAAIEAVLAKHWDDELAALYGQLAHAEPRRALGVAERWLDRHPSSSGVLLALGRLCRREQLWGKAEAFLQRALGGRPAEAWEALGELYIDRGDQGRAQQALRNALLAARGENTAPLRALLGPPAEHAEPERRTSMGLPRLAQDDE